MNIPLLILSDSPSCSSGLGRITRDLATRIHENVGDVFEVATVGYGGPGSSKHSFREYNLHSVDNWLPVELPPIWDDFTQGREGIWFSIWDASRFWWVNHPSAPPHLRQWLETAKMKKWLYHPVDAEGPNGKLSLRLAETLKHFDRVLDYSAFSCRVTGNTEHLPHGIDTTAFRPYDRGECKRRFRDLGFHSLKDDSFLVGIVATNQARKDWALGLETCKILLDRGLDVQVWCHVDVLERYWSLPNLIADFGLQGRVIITNARFTDEQMAQFYSACDVTLGIGLGEGFGFPTYESLACGTPVVAGDYCGSEWLPSSVLVSPETYRHEGIYSCRRPVYSPEKWADNAWLASAGYGAMILPPELDWNGTTLWPKWRQWLLDGVK